jgi:peptidoglycan/LPS O-acetylase OafA/YrhL
MNTPRANEIDLLRFLAALAVVLFHYAFRGYAAHSSSMPYPLLAGVAKYGRYGVDLFFLISGFVILMSASGGSLKHFVVSRIVRLYPAFWACCTLTFLILVAFGPQQHPPTFIQYLSNMTMLCGFGFMQKLAAVSQIDGSYWSLIIEIRFYALVALLLLLRQIHRAELFLTGWLLTIIVFELARIDHLREVLIVDYAAYFIAGAMFFQIRSQGLSFLRVGVILGSWALSLYEAWISLPRFEATVGTPMNRYIVLSLITLFFLVMSMVAQKRTTWVGRQNWMLLGALTYPLYLVHQSIGYLIFNHFYPGSNPHLLLWGTVSLMIAIAYLINVHVERRFSGVFKQLLNRWWDAARAFFIPVARLKAD